MFVCIHVYIDTVFRHEYRLIYNFAPQCDKETTGIWHWSINTQNEYYGTQCIVEITSTSYTYVSWHIHTERNSFPCKHMVKETIAHISTVGAHGEKYLGVVYTKQQAKIRKWWPFS